MHEGSSKSLLVAALSTLILAPSPAFPPFLSSHFQSICSSPSRHAMGCSLCASVRGPCSEVVLFMSAVIALATAAPNPCTSTLHWWNASTGYWARPFNGTIAWASRTQARVPPLRPLATSVLVGKRVVILGDSQAYRAARYLVSAIAGCPFDFKWPLPPCIADLCPLIKQGARCFNGKAFYSLQPPRKPIHIPVSGKAQPPQCTDCLYCNPFVAQCPNSTVQIEFYPIEFSRDGEVQSTQFATTQENVVGKYLPSMGTPDLLLFNVGLHDAGRVSNSAFARNLERYASLVAALMQQQCKGWPLYVLTTAVYAPFQKQKYRKLTSNRNIQMHNDLAVQIMQNKSISVLNGYSLGAPLKELAEKKDPVHKNAIYLETFWAIVLSFFK